MGTERRRSQCRRVRRHVHRVRHELSVPLHGQLGEAQRSRPAIRRRRVRARGRAAARAASRRRGSSSTRRARTRAIRMRPARRDAWPCGARAARARRSIFDVDGDGDLDIVTNEFNAAPMVLISNLTEKTRVHYVAVKLTGTTSNRDGLGAVVKVTAGGSTYTKVLDGNSDICRTACIRCTSGSARRKRSTASRCCGRRGRSRPCSRRSRSIRGSRCASSNGDCRAKGGSFRRGPRPGLHRPVADLRVLRRLRDELRVEARIRRIEGVRGLVDGPAQIVDVAVNERSAHAGAVGDVELVALAGRDAAAERVLPEDRVDVGAARRRRRRRRSSCR